MLVRNFAIHNLISRHHWNNSRPFPVIRWAVTCGKQESHPPASTTNKFSDGINHHLLLPYSPYDCPTPPIPQHSGRGCAAASGIRVPPPGSSVHDAAGGAEGDVFQPPRKQRGGDGRNPSGPADGRCGILPSHAHNATASGASDVRAGRQVGLRGLGSEE